jgi:hypothetical protein
MRYGCELRELLQVGADTMRAILEKRLIQMIVDPTWLSFRAKARNPVAQFNGDFTGDLDFRST